MKNSDVSERTKSAKTAIRKSGDPIKFSYGLSILAMLTAQLRNGDDGNVIGVYVSFR